MTTAKTPTRSLVEFVKDKKRKACAVCSLPAEVRTQLATAREKKITRADVLEWLKSEGIAIKAEDLAAHTNGHHGDA